MQYDPSIISSLFLLHGTTSLGFQILGQTFRFRSSPPTSRAPPAVLHGAHPARPLACCRSGNRGLRAVRPPRRRRIAWRRLRSTPSSSPPRRAAARAPCPDPASHGALHRRSRRLLRRAPHPAVWPRPPHLPRAGSRRRRPGHAPPDLADFSAAAGWDPRRPGADPPVGTRAARPGGILHRCRLGPATPDCQNTPPPQCGSALPIPSPSVGRLKPLSIPLSHAVPW